MTLGEKLRRSWALSVPTGIVGLVAIALLALWMKQDEDEFLGILDSANLVFHEAGHKVYGALGETAGLYGGTLGQLTFPVLASVIFAWRRQAVGLAICLAWLGQNFFNIARYCADARAQELPLVGGGDHDWTKILARWHALSRDTVIAERLRYLAWGLVLVAALFLAYRTWRAHKEPRSEA
jgi:hypothetical protein